MHEEKHGHALMARQEELMPLLAALYCSSLTASAATAFFLRCFMLINAAQPFL